MADITLSAAVRQNLLSLTSVSDLISRTQGRLSTGLRVASPIDDAKAFFEAKSLSDRASDLSEKKAGIDQAISSVNAALNAIESIDTVIKQLKGLLLSAKSATGSQLTSISTQYDTLRTQVNLVAGDATYQGLNLVNNTTSTLTVSFSNLTTSVLTISATDLQISSTALSLSSAANFSLTSEIDSRIAQADVVITTLRGEAQKIGANVAFLQTRLDFTQEYVNVLEAGAGKLTLADLNEEGANLVSLQTRQQLGISSLSFAAQAEQSVLALFR